MNFVLLLLYISNSNFQICSCNLYFFCAFFHYRLLVGAPLGQNLQPSTNRSGALFKCPITQDDDDCEQVITDGRRSKCRYLKQKQTSLNMNYNWIQIMFFPRKKRISSF